MEHQNIGRDDFLGEEKCVTTPKSINLVGFKWVYTIKCKSEGTIERYKAYFIAKGFDQKYEIAT